MYRWGITLIRVITGFIFLMHGIAKLQMGVDNVSAWFGSIGLPTPLAYLVILIEVLGGLALIVGLGSRYVAILMILTMIGAIFSVKLPGGLLGDGKGAGYELDLALIALNLLFVMKPYEGVGIDSYLQKRRENK